MPNMFPMNSLAKLNTNILDFTMYKSPKGILVVITAYIPPVTIPKPTKAKTQDPKGPKKTSYAGFFLCYIPHTLPQLVAAGKPLYPRRYR